MKRTGLFLLLSLVFIILAACGGSPEAVVSDSVVAESVVLELGPTVDVATTAAVKDRDDVILIDVREEWEYDEGHIPGITLIPMNEIPNRLSEIPTDKEVIVTCRSGNRSGQITDYLRKNGFDNVHNMQGGILAWQQAGYEVER